MGNFNSAEIAEILVHQKISRCLMAKKSTLSVVGTEITIIIESGQKFISLTDMLKAKDGDYFISDWLRNRNTVEFLGVWESIYNPNFNYGEFDIIKSQAGLKSYRISIKEWVAQTNAIGIKATRASFKEHIFYE